MLWWLLILGISAVAVVSVAATLFMRVRRQLKRTAGRAESDSLDQHSSLPEG